MRKFFLTAWFAIAVASVCQAVPVTISFSGTAAEPYDSDGFPTIAAGTPFSGVIKYDTSELASPACCGSYGTALGPLDGIWLQIGKYTFSASGSSAHINYYGSQIGSLAYDDLNFFDSSGAGWTTNIPGLPGPIFGSISLLGDAGFVPLQPNLPAPNPSLFDPSLYNLISGGNGLCTTDPGSIDCGTVIDLNISSIALVPAPEPNMAGSVLLATALLLCLRFRRSFITRS